MKIGPPTDMPMAPTGSQGQPTARSGGAAAPATASSRRQHGVAVSVSPEARTIAGAGQDEGSEIDMDKVRAVRAAIDNGSYVVNAEAIADKLLANAQEMLDRSRH